MICLGVGVENSDVERRWLVPAPFDPTVIASSRCDSSRCEEDPDAGLLPRAYKLLKTYSDNQLCQIVTAFSYQDWQAYPKK